MDAGLPQNGYSNVKNRHMVPMASYERIAQMLQHFYLLSIVPSIPFTQVVAASESLAIAFVLVPAHEICAISWPSELCSAYMDL